MLFLRPSKDGQIYFEIFYITLASDPFLEVTHYWPFVTSHTLLTPDILTGHNAIIMENAEIRSDKDFGEYLSTERKGSYVIAGDFKGMLMLCFLFNPLVTRIH